MKVDSMPLFISFFVLAFISHIQGQSTLPPIVHHSIENLESFQELPSPKWMIEVGASELTIEDLLNENLKDGKVTNIVPKETIVEMFHSYWFAIELHSDVSLEGFYLYFENEPTGFGFTNNYSEIESFFVQDGKVLSKGRTGYFVPASQRDLPDRHSQSMLKIDMEEKSSVTLWVHIKKNHQLEDLFPALSLYNTNIVLPKYAHYVRDMVFTGSLIVILVIAILLFFWGRDQVSKWFLIFVGILFIDHFTSWASDPLTPLLYPETPKIGLYVGIWTSILMVACMLQFVRVFSELQKTHPRIDRAIKIGIAFLVFSGLVFPVLSLTLETIVFSDIYFSLYGLVYVSTGITMLILPFGRTRLMGIAMLLFILPQLLPLNSIDFQSLAYVGLLMPMILGVGYRFKKLSEERVEAEKEKRVFLDNQNRILEERVEKRTEELKASLENLKSTQAQLVQSEKMASLGELTAGIAHEIQNPLNFVNNFSDVSGELLEEIKEERGKKIGDRDDELIEEVIGDLQENLQKISHHGSRASSIVKGMLDHSRESTGEKESTDINALCDEYLRLSYHGFKAKDNNFTGEFELDLEADIPSVQIVTQDMGRVLLNIFNNAFYAVHQKNLLNPEFQPKVDVSTRHKGNKIEITIKDNGIGMSQETMDKVFQPFFTTKPTGQGTGLGMSISYDIVTKGHGGEMRINSIEGEKTEFIIQLPIDIEAE